MSDAQTADLIATLADRNIHSVLDLELEFASICTAIAAIDHPCHDVCVGKMHADCQCAGFVRQEAIRAVQGFWP